MSGFHRMRLTGPVCDVTSRRRCRRGRLSPSSTSAGRATVSGPLLEMTGSQGRTVTSASWRASKVVRRPTSNSIMTARTITRKRQAFMLIDPSALTEIEAFKRRRPPGPDRGRKPGTQTAAAATQDGSRRPERRSNARLRTSPEVPNAFDCGAAPLAGEPGSTLPYIQQQRHAASGLPLPARRPVACSN